MSDIIQNPLFQLDMPGAPGVLVVRSNRPMSDELAGAHLDMLMHDYARGHSDGYKCSGYVFDGLKLILSVEPC